jgi:hypothetical protein
MIVNEVEYTRLVSLPGYENKRIGATAGVEYSETPGEALARLADWVDAQLGLPEEAVALAEKVASLKREKADLEMLLVQGRSELRKHQRFQGILNGTEQIYPGDWSFLKDMLGTTNPPLSRDWKPTPTKLY